MPPSPSIYYYSIYGLTVASDFLLPEVSPLESPPPTIDVSVTKCRICSQTNNIDESKDFDWHASDGYFSLHLEHTGKFLVLDGNKIVVEPYKDADVSRIRVFLLGTCFGVLIHQKRLLPIHGCAIATSSGCKVFAGPVGIGKSTLAAAFLKCGYKVLADDVSVISITESEKPIVYPSYPQIKICPDSALKLEFPIENLPPVDAAETKFRYPVTHNHHKEPMMLSAIYILTTYENNEFSINQLDGSHKFQQLMANTYRSTLINSINVGTSHFELCAALVNLVPMYRLYRSSRSFEIISLVEFLEKHFH